MSINYKVSKGFNKFVNGFYIKDRHIVIQNKNDEITKIATSIIDIGYEQSVVMFFLKNNRWNKKNVSLDNFIKKYGSEYIPILEVVDCSNGEKYAAEELLYRNICFQIEYIKNNLYDIFCGRSDELEYLVSLVYDYEGISNIPLQIPFSIQSWNEPKIFDEEKEFVYGGLPMLEDVDIEIEYMKELGIDNAEKHRENLKRIAFNRFAEILIEYDVYFNQKNWIRKEYN